MSEQKFLRIARAIHRLSAAETGRTTFNNALAEFAESFCTICRGEPGFDQRAFLAACALSGASHE